MSRPAHDLVIIGGGHNGLVCAAYCAAAGLDVAIVEKRPVLGGAAVTEEFHPGFRNSAAAYTVSLLHPRIMRDLRLAENGLRIVERRLANFWPHAEGTGLALPADIAGAQAEVARFSKADAVALPGYLDTLARTADLLRDLVLETPPNAGGGWREMLKAARLLGRLRRLSLEEERTFLDFFTKSAADLLAQWFENAHVKGALGFDSIVGAYHSPCEAASAYVLLHHAFGEVNGKRGLWGHAIGGMGAITRAMAREAARRGVSVHRDAPVREVLIEGRRATGVVLADGRTLTARAVAANASLKLLYTELVDAAVLPGDFLRRMRAFRCASGTFRMNVALAELPQFACRPASGVADHHTAGIIIGPTLDYLDRAFRDARADGWSREPVIEMLIPSTLDATLAPAGRHVASLFCQHFAPALPGGRSWDEAREAAADHVIATVDRYAPGFARSVIARRILSPLDLEREFGLVGGDIFHGALGLDQLFSARPMLGYADYRGPVAGLYHCGAGAHPGGGVTGLAGHNAAREIIRDLRRRR
ncbi:MAG: phytoene desaturase family protein [Rhodothalassiaceae bacterium]